MHKLVLLRHGESVWNQENLFTGWTDVGLSEKGIEEAHQAGKTLLAELQDGRFAMLQSASRLYATYGKDAEAKFDGRAEKEIASDRKEVASFLTVLKKFPDPAKVEAGELG